MLRSCGLSFEVAKLQKCRTEASECRCRPRGSDPTHQSGGGLWRVWVRASTLGCPDSPPPEPAHVMFVAMCCHSSSFLDICAVRQIREALQVVRAPTIAGHWNASAEWPWKMQFYCFVGFCWQGRHLLPISQSSSSTCLSQFSRDFDFF